MVNQYKSMASISLVWFQRKYLILFPVRRCMFLVFVPVTIFYIVSNNSKKDHVVAYLTYKRCTDTSQQSVLFWISSIGSIQFYSHCVDACIGIFVHVTIFYNVSNNSKKEYVVTYSTYKRCTDTSQRSVLFWISSIGSI